jgi:hypothetical protein
MDKKELKDILNKYDCELIKLILFAIIDDNNFVREQIIEFVEALKRKGAIS